MKGENRRTETAIDYESLGTKVVSLLLLFELVSVFFLWTFNAVGPDAESTFALLLAADLVSFAMISYVYRVLNREDRFGRLPLLAGCVFICVLLFFGLV